MDQPTLVLLPGLDGTGDLFLPLLGVLPGHVTTRVVTYPTGEALSYPALSDLVEGQLRTERDVVLVAESFSGPVALRYAAAHPARVRAVVLCASFVRAPLPRWLRYLAAPLLLRIPPPAFALRRLMVGRNASESLVRAVRESIRRVAPHVLAGRLRDVFDLDCSYALRECAAPILYLVAAGDALVGRSCVEAVRAVNPHVSVRTVDGPHLLLQSEPRAAWREVARFLTDTPSCGGAWE
jgi:pimeloyl-[acyl-carrier protein] methyl ester esterase